MSVLFNRSATLAIGKTGATGIDVSNLRIKFDIKKTNGSTLNNSNISVYNMNQTNRAFVEGEDLTCILKVGYVSLLEDLFKGTITDVVHDKQGVDIVSSLAVIEKQKKIVETHIEQNFKAGTTTEGMLRKILQTFGMASKAITALISSVKTKGISNLSKTNTSSTSLTGNFKEVMDKILAKEDVKWYMDDGQLVLDKDSNTDTVNAVVLNKTSGLLGAPSKKKDTIEVVSLIQPGLKPGATVKVESKNINGFFKVLEAKYSGDTHEGTWQVRLTVK